MSIRLPFKRQRHNGHIVSGTGGKRRLDQCAAYCLRLAALWAADRDVLVAQAVCQPVGAQEENVALSGLCLKYVASDKALAADDAGDDVFARVLPCLLTGEAAKIHQLLHERVVMRELCHNAVGYAVCPAVTDVQQRHAVTVGIERDQRCAHALTLRILHGAAIHVAIGLVRTGTEALRNFVAATDLQCSGGVLHKAAAGDVAGGTTGGCTAHAVAHDGKHSVGKCAHGKAVLVFQPHLSYITCSKNFHASLIFFRRS